MIYLDSNATSQPAPEVIEAMLPYLRDQWVNPSSSYVAAKLVKQAMATAREQVAGLIGAQPEEVIFTSCGTESIQAVHDSVRALWPEKGRLVISGTEHAAVMECAKRWTEGGGEVVRVGVDAGGRLDMDHLRRAVADGRAGLVSIMWANNETGVIAPMAEIVGIAGAAGAQVHTDAVQAVGKVAVDVAAVPVDYLSLSGHKFHAPKGVGALYVSRRRRFRPLIVGGGQEDGRRSGTENVPAVVGLGCAAALMRAALADGTEERVRGMRDAFEEGVLEALPGTVVNGNREYRLPTTSSLTFPGIDAAGLLILLDKADVCCSAGSACHSASVHPSHVLEAMGCDVRHAASTLRFSFSRLNSGAEVPQAVARVAASVERLRGLMAAEDGPVVVEMKG